MDYMQYSGQPASLSDREQRVIEQADRKRKANSGFYPRIYLEVASEDYIGNWDYRTMSHGSQCGTCHSTARYQASSECIHCKRVRDAEYYKESKQDEG